MKLDRIIWGILFLFVGGVILLDNFDVINFYWRNVWQFWPLLLIIIGANMLAGKKDSQIGNIITLVILVVALGFVFWKGQQPRDSSWFGIQNSRNGDLDWDENGIKDELSFEEVMPAIVPGLAKLEFDGGAIAVDLTDSTTNLLNASVRQKSGDMTLSREDKDSTVVLKFSGNRKKKTWNLGDSSDQLNLQLNKAVVWDMDFEMGAGSLDMDLSNYKVRKFEFKGGASALDVKLGNTLPLTEVQVKAGVADISLKVPAGSGCRITTKSGLSTRDLKGFKRIKQGLYETEGYSSAVNKIIIEFEGGLANFSVERY